MQNADKCIQGRRNKRACSGRFKVHKCEEIGLENLVRNEIGECIKAMLVGIQ